MTRYEYLSKVSVHALLTYGADSQLGMVQEECGELIAAINHTRRGRNNMGELVGECADLIIVLRQLEIMLELSGVDVEAEVEKKLERLESRMKDVNRE